MFVLIVYWIEKNVCTSSVGTGSPSKTENTFQNLVGNSRRFLCETVGDSVCIKKKWKLPTVIYVRNRRQMYILKLLFF